MCGAVGLGLQGWEMWGSAAPRHHSPSAPLPAPPPPTPLTSRCPQARTWMWTRMGSACQREPLPRPEMALRCGSGEETRNGGGSAGMGRGGNCKDLVHHKTKGYLTCPQVSLLDRNELCHLLHSQPLQTHQDACIMSCFQSAAERPSWAEMTAGTGLWLGTSSRTAPRSFQVPDSMAAC